MVSIVETLLRFKFFRIQYKGLFYIKIEIIKKLTEISVLFFDIFQKQIIFYKYKYSKLWSHNYEFGFMFLLIIFQIFQQKSHYF